MALPVSPATSGHRAAAPLALRWCLAGLSAALLLHLAMLLPSSGSRLLGAADMQRGESSAIAMGDSSRGHAPHQPAHAMLVTCVVLTAAVGARVLAGNVGAEPAIQRPTPGVRLTRAAAHADGAARARGPTRVEAGVLLRI